MHILIHYIIMYIIILLSHNSYIFFIYQRESFKYFVSILDIDIRDVRARLSLWKSRLQWINQLLRAKKCHLQGCVHKSYSRGRAAFNWPIRTKKPLLLFCPDWPVGPTLRYPTQDFRTLPVKIDLKMAAPRSSDHRVASIWDASLRDRRPSSSSSRGEWRPINVSNSTINGDFVRESDRPFHRTMI